MDRNSNTYKAYVEILRRELVPAMGCTEPIAVAYCAAVARKTLGKIPQRIEIFASGNIIKNVKSVIVPHAGGLRGLEAAAALGALFGKAESCLEVVACVTADEERSLAERMKNINITVAPLESDNVLDIIIKVSADGDCASVRIVDEHTNIVEITKNGMFEQIVFYA